MISDHALFPLVRMLVLHPIFEPFVRLSDHLFGTFFKKLIQGLGQIRIPPAIFEIHGFHLRSLAADARVTKLMFSLLLHHGLLLFLPRITEIYKILPGILDVSFIFVELNNSVVVVISNKQLGSPVFESHRIGNLDLKLIGG